MRCRVIRVKSTYFLVHHQKRTLFCPSSELLGKERLEAGDIVDVGGLKLSPRGDQGQKIFFVERPERVTVEVMTVKPDRDYAFGQTVSPTPPTRVFIASMHFEDGTKAAPSPTFASLSPGDLLTCRLEECNDYDERHAPIAYGIRRVTA